MNVEQVTDERDRLAEFARYVLKAITTEDELDDVGCQAKALELNLIFEDIATEEDTYDRWYAEPGEPLYRIQTWLEEIDSVTGID